MKDLNKNRKGYKNTPIGWVPEDWDKIKLNDIGDTYPGLTGKSKEDFGYGKPYIPYLNIFNNSIIKHDDYDYVNIKPNENQQKVLKGDLFFTTSSETPGEVGMCSTYLGNQSELYLNSFCFGFRIRDINKVSSVYITHFFRSQIGRSILYKLAQGATRYNLSKSQFLKLFLYIPKISEQKKINDILNKCDVILEVIQKLISAKEQLKNGLMQQLLTGMIRLPGFNGEWKKIKLKDVFDRVTRKNTERNPNVVTVSAHRGFVKQTDFFNKVIASDILDNYFLLEKGEFVYNKSYCNGYDWGATKRLKEFDKAVVTTLYICFKIKDDANHSAEYFEHFFNASLLDHGLTKIAHEGGRAHGLLNVTPSDFFNLEVSVPEHKEQIAITRALSAIDREIELLKSQLELYRQQKKGLMQVLLTGAVRVKV